MLSPISTVLKSVMKPFYFNFDILQHVWRGGEFSLEFQGGALTSLTVKLAIVKRDVNSVDLVAKRLFLSRSSHVSLTTKLFVEASRLKGS